MKFEQITNEVMGAKNAGYEIDPNAERQIDEQYAAEIKADRGEAFLNSVIDSFADFEGDLYRGEDGQMYVVEMVCHRGNFRPLVWHAVRTTETAK